MSKIIDRAGSGIPITPVENDVNLDSLHGINQVIAGATHTVDITDQGDTLEFTNAGAVAVTLDSIATIQGAAHTSDFHITLIATNAATVATITPNGANSFNTGVATIVLTVDEYITLETDSTGLVWNIINSSDASQVGGLSASQFLRSDANDTATGDLTFSGANTHSGGDTFSGNVGLDSTWDIAGTAVTVTAANINDLVDKSSAQTISGAKTFSANVTIDKATPVLTIQCADEATEDTIFQFLDESSNQRALIFRPQGLDRLRLDVRNAAGVLQAALDITEAGDVDVAVGTFKATGAELTSPVINTGVSGTAGVSRMIQETAQATTSGSSKDFTGIPSWVKEISFILDEVSSDAVTTDFICQIGDSGGLETTNYSYTVSTSKVASIVTTSNTADSSIHVTSLTPAASHCNGEVKIINVNSNVWEFSGLLSDPVSNELYSIAGRKSLSGTLDRLRFSLTSGAFDAGQVNIIYKG